MFAYFNQPANVATVRVAAAWRALTAEMPQSRLSIQLATDTTESPKHFGVGESP